MTSSWWQSMSWDMPWAWSIPTTLWPSWLHFTSGWRQITFSCLMMTGWASSKSMVRWVGPRALGGPPLRYAVEACGLCFCFSSYQPIMSNLSKVSQAVAPHRPCPQSQLVDRSQGHLRHLRGTRTALEPQKDRITMDPISVKGTLTRLRCFAEKCLFSR